MTAVSTERALTASFADEVHAFLVSLDVSRWQVSMRSSLDRTLADCQRRAAELHARYALDDRADEAEACLRTAALQLAEALPDPVAWRATRAEEITRIQERLEPLYESVARALARSGMPTVQRSHPTNMLRSSLHMALGLGVVALYEHLLTPTTALLAAGGFVAWAWSTEGIRRLSPRFNDRIMAFFGPVARQHEYNRVNSGTWFGTALLVLVLTAPDPASVLGLTALAVGDPVAGIVGRRFGRIRFASGRSLEGTLGFMGSAWIVSLGVLALYHADLGWGLGLAMATATAVSGGLAELWSRRVDDNLSIPLVAGWAAALVHLAWGLLS